MGCHVLRGATLACVLLLSGSSWSQAVPAAPRSVASASAAPAPVFKPRGDAGLSSTGSWPSTLLLAGLGVAGGWAWWRRAAGKRLAVLSNARPAASTVQRLHSQALTPQASVHALRWNGEDFLLACTSQQVTLLARAPSAGTQGAGS